MPKTATKTTYENMLAKSCEQIAPFARRAFAESGLITDGCMIIKPTDKFANRIQKLKAWQAMPTDTRLIDLEKFMKDYDSMPSSKTEQLESFHMDPRPGLHNLDNGTEKRRIKDVFGLPPMLEFDASRIDLVKSQYPNATMRVTTGSWNILLFYDDGQLVAVVNGNRPDK